MTSFKLSPGVCSVLVLMVGTAAGDRRPATGRQFRHVFSRGGQHVCVEFWVSKFSPSIHTDQVNSSCTGTIAPPAGPSIGL